jgi:glycosyltransferase involved in cell wall biosynthesis
LGKDYALFEKVVHELERRGHPTTTAVLEGIAADQVPAFLRGLGCMLVTSRHEGSPVITKEAACTGTRIVSTDVGDVREQLHGLSGCRVVAERAEASLADAVLAVLGEPGPDPVVAADRFAVGIEARRVFEVYEGLLRAASL